METPDTPLTLLPTQVLALMAAVSRQVRDKSPKTWLDCFTLLTSLVIVLPRGFERPHGSGAAATTVLSDVSWGGLGR